ncbi:ribbon-helix-helix protein, CopG family [Salinisphaera sp. P385]|uniref:Ribbon-helix-helix protein, CopG family n=1 Tax=Spectribacter acetivorans TaxID=3075603 RepID=A0ABU3B4Y5_9GAMM|nr:ribbon-helix-helix protein, CopG family [Salinisphaera sp. P385]MDT0617517.1 ribbon-helix-helix protein, CopG family [Salinisphaera sp. P385]
MVRTIISLDPEEKKWLDQQAQRSGRTMTAVVREALSQYREREIRRGQPSQAELLIRTQGLWTRGDGLEWQEQWRGEWTER